MFIVIAKPIAIEFWGFCPVEDRTIRQVPRYLGLLALANQRTCPAIQATHTPDQQPSSAGDAGPQHDIPTSDLPVSSSALLLHNHRHVQNQRQLTSPHDMTLASPP